MPASDKMGRRIAIGAVCWIATAEFFLAQIVAQWAANGYSIPAHDISFLGIAACGPFVDPATGATFDICSPLHSILNAAFVLLGILTLAGAVLTRKAWPQGRSAKVGLIMLGIAAFGPIASGLWPVDVNFPMHAGGAVLHFLIGTTGIVVLGFSQLRDHRLYGVFSIVCGVTAFAGFMLYGSQTYLDLGRGGMQRLAAYPSLVWMAATGIALLTGAIPSAGQDANPIRRRG